MMIQTLLARDIMNQDVIKVGPDMKLSALAKLLEERHISGVPVVDAANKLVGVVSQTDIIRFYASKVGRPSPANSYFQESLRENGKTAGDAAAHFGDNRVEEIMTQETFAFQETVPVTKIAKAMTELHMHRVIIVDEDFNLSGVVSTMDMVRLIANLKA